MSLRPIQKIFLTSLLVLSFGSVCFAQNKQVKSFSKAKEHLRELYKDIPTFYCSCRHDGRKIFRESCGYVPNNDNARAKRIEWEHVFPISWLREEFPEWENGHPDCGDKKGRRCARKVSEKFRKAEADLYNLRPSVGELNAVRSNFSFGLVRGEDRNYGKCNFEVGEELVEIMPDIVGDVARVYWYMFYTYMEVDLSTSPSMSYANRIDPVSKEECEIGKKVEAIQGNRHELLYGECIKNELWDE